MLIIINAYYIFCGMLPLLIKIALAIPIPNVVENNCTKTR